jgi:hypothetical protein
MRTILFLPAGLLTVGCSQSPPKPVPVSGTVTFDGKPLTDAQILFVEPGQSPLMLEIKDGRFEGEASPSTGRSGSRPCARPSPDARQSWR